MQELDYSLRHILKYQACVEVSKQCKNQNIFEILFTVSTCVEFDSWIHVIVTANHGVCNAGNRNITQPVYLYRDDEFSSC